jgi:periplasmic protein TonB
MTDIDKIAPPVSHEGDGRPALRPLVGLPQRAESRWGGPTFSFLAHALLVLLLFLPSFIQATIEVTEEGAGGPGPAGGGGGGSGGTGGVRAERLQYMEVAPAKPSAVPSITPPVIPPPEVKPPEPVVTPPPTPPPTETKADEAKTAATEATSVVAGVGGGSGNDGSAGMGPGSGGGVGSGVGTGRGSGTGPGTGGGTGAVYSAQPTSLSLLPQPVPSRVRPYTLEAIFEVDERGRAKVLQWNRSKDNGYNQKIEKMLQEIRFRPAVRASDGMPVVDTAKVIFSAPG